jgi:CRISPR-associated protein Cas2
MFIVVTYDIADDRRRLQVSGELENFGARVNFSVFECHVEADALVELKNRLGKVIDPAEDNVRYYVLCDGCAKKLEIQGKGEITRNQDYFIV